MPFCFDPNMDSNAVVERPNELFVLSPRYEGMRVRSPNCREVATSGWPIRRNRTNHSRTSAAISISVIRMWDHNAPRPKRSQSPSYPVRSRFPRRAIRLRPRNRGKQSCSSVSGWITDHYSRERIVRTIGPVACTACIPDRRGDCDCGIRGSGQSRAVPVQCESPEHGGGRG